MTVSSATLTVAEFWRIRLHRAHVALNRREALMAHMKGVEPAEAGWFTRLVYWFVRRKFGKLTGKNRLIEPVKVAAHHPRLLRALGQIEGALEAARSVPAQLKLLASLKAATLIGCPF